MKIQKKKHFFGGGVGGEVGGLRGRGRVGGVRVDVNESRIELFLKIQKKNGGGEGGSMGVRVGGSGWM